MCLPQLILYYINEGINTSDSGFIISFLICSAISFILVLLSKRYFSASGDKAGRIINFVFLSYIIPISLYNLSLCQNALISVGGGKISAELSLLIIVFSSAAAAYLGSEALSRCALISFYIMILIFGFICIISFDGWDAHNLYPLLGNNAKSTFFSFNSIGIYSGLVSVFAIKDNISSHGAFASIKRAFFAVFFLGCVAVFLCIITTPYPLGSLYDFSLAGIFSVARSGSFFHRFEIILVFMLILISFNSLSFSLYLSSKTLAGIGKTDDIRPYVLLISAFLFYAQFKGSLMELSFVASNIFALALALVFVFKKRKKNNELGENI